MKHISLATRYRPQRFDEIAGQDLVKAVLSRASAEDRVASGYLFSGTRGVGKTTIARIFAKALNCEKAPCAEPCNECASCRRITAGGHPDVIEMDGASNNTVDDARALRETVGFAPMEGRYKIFIIDEAHMLTRNAFNALLKTLEEPPPHVVFIFATTEIFRFPATILSRCQVFSFRHLTEDVITRHLARVLTSEHMAFEEAALRLVARRAAGSARDSMSLLDQILAYGPETLTTDSVRTVLGLAGPEAMQQLFETLAAGSCGEAALFTRDLVSREVDIGFFLRELTDAVRSLFLLHQCDRDTVARLGVSEGELDLLSSLAPKFTPGWLHAAWQMILDNQRPVASSQDPAAALELLLVNLALLPRLLPASLVHTEGGQAASPAAAASAANPRQQPHAAPRTVPPLAPQMPAGTARENAHIPARDRAPAGHREASHTSKAAPDEPEPAPAPAARPAPVQTPEPAAIHAPVPEPATRPAPAQTPEPAAVPTPAPQRPAQRRPIPASADDAPPWDDIPVDSFEAGCSSEAATAAPGMGRPLDMQSFRTWLGQQQDAAVPTRLTVGLRVVTSGFDTVVLECDSQSMAAAVRRRLDDLSAELSRYLGRRVRADIRLSDQDAQTRAVQTKADYNRPELRYCFEILKAHVERVRRS